VQLSVRVATTFVQSPILKSGQACNENGSEGTNHDRTRLLSENLRLSLGGAGEVCRKYIVPAQPLPADAIVILLPSADSAQACPHAFVAPIEFQVAPELVDSQTA
jgi:hypothetical protein